MNLDPQMFPRHGLRHAVRPFHQADAVTLEVLLRSEFRELARAREAVRIEVVDGQSSGVFLDQHERGAIHRGRVANVEPFRDGSHQVRLARSERTDESDDAAREEQFPQATPEGLGGLEVRNIDREVHRVE